MCAVSALSWPCPGRRAGRSCRSDSWRIGCAPYPAPAVWPAPPERFRPPSPPAPLPPRRWLSSLRRSHSGPTPPPGVEPTRRPAAPTGGGRRRPARSTAAPSPRQVRPPAAASRRGQGPPAGCCGWAAGAARFDLPAASGRAGDAVLTGPARRPRDRSARPRRRRPPVVLPWSSYRRYGRAGRSPRRVTVPRRAGDRPIRARRNAGLWGAAAALALVQGRIGVLHQLHRLRPAGRRNAAGWGPTHASRGLGRPPRPGVGLRELRRPGDRRAAADVVT